MDMALGTLTNVLISSSMYILVALGFAFIFNMMGILNLAHGAIYMVGGYATCAIGMLLGLNPWLALLISVAVMTLFGVFFARYYLQPFTGNFNAAVVACIAVTQILQTSVNIMAGAKKMIVPNFVKGIFETPFFSISNERMVTFAIGAVFVILIMLFVNKTKLGQQMQAITQDREGATLQGIRVKRVSALACAIGCGLAALAGSLLGAILGISPFMGDYIFIKILILVIVAGAGSIGGIALTGILLGAFDNILPVLIDPNTAQVIIISVIIVILLIRPQGFFGHEVPD
jgi:branched-chain amino acid transport system permease protein